MSENTPSFEHVIGVAIGGIQDADKRGILIARIVRPDDGLHGTDCNSIDIAEMRLALEEHFDIDLDWTQAPTTFASLHRQVCVAIKNREEVEVHPA